MAKIQVVGIRPYAGIGKESGKPFNMLNVKVVATDNDGVIEVGELTFFERQSSPLPKLEVGKVYEPTISFVTDKGTLRPTITSLQLVQAVRAAA